MFTLCHYFQHLHKQIIEIRYIVYWGHPTKKYIHNANMVPGILHFYLRSQPSVIAEEFAMAHSSFLIPFFFVNVSQERKVWLVYCALPIGSRHPFPLPFLYLSKYKSVKNFSPALLHSDMYAVWISVNKMQSFKIWEVERRWGLFSSSSNRCQCLRWFYILLQGLVSSTGM